MIDSNVQPVASLTIKPAATRLGVSVSALRRWALAGSVSSSRNHLGQLTFYPIELDQLRERLNWPTISEAAHALGYDRTNVNRWVREGQIPYWNAPDGVMRIPPHDFENLKKKLDGLTLKQVSSHTGKSQSTIRRRIKEGRLAATETPSGNRFNLATILQMESQDNVWISSGEAAAIARCDNQTLVRMARDGELRHKKVGSHWRFLKVQIVALRDYMDQLLSTEETAKLLGCEYETVLSWVRSGILETAPTPFKKEYFFEAGVVVQYARRNGIRIIWRSA